MARRSRDILAATGAVNVTVTEINTLTNIENLTGGFGDDVLRGDHNANEIDDVTAMTTFMAQAVQTM